MAIEKLLHQKTDIVIELENVTVSFPPIAAQLDEDSSDKTEDVILKNISLQIKHGETLGIIGPSGGGKTFVALDWLLHIASGKATPRLRHSGASVNGWETASDTDTITFDGTTTGGILGDFVELIDVAADKWMVRVQSSSTGSESTPFSATVS